MSGNFLVPALAAVALVAFSASGFAGESTTVKGNSNRGHLTPNITSRMGGGGGHSNWAKVRGTKSNTSERMGGGGGVRGGGSGSPTGAARDSGSVGIGCADPRAACK